MSVERAGIGRKAVALDEFGLGGHGLEEFENGVEAFDVADLQHTVFLARQHAQLRRLRGIVGHGLFDQHMFAPAEQVAGDFKMRGGGGRDVEGVAGGGGFGDGAKDLELVFLGDFAGRLGVRVENAGEFHLAGGVEFGINARVVLAEGAGPQHGDFDFCHARSLPAGRRF